MSVKASVSLTNQQDDFARSLVSDGQYSSFSAVIQRGLELLRTESERERTELLALKAFFEERANGPFLTANEGRERTQQMIARKRSAQDI